ncbi:hypothetical protein Gotur_017472 [Gossypium turneri]
MACPVTHVWYLKRLPSYIANLLDKPLKELETVMCDLIEIIILQIRNEKLSSHSIELGCPESDMSLGKSSMKLRIMGVFNTPK